jgi:hypothetical protein
MSYDISSKRGERPSKLDAIARKCRLDEEDEVRALTVYHGMLDAIAERVASSCRKPSAPPSVVYIAAYQHRYGVDLSAHGSRDHAESRLLSIAWNQCMRDPDIRAAVDARFGPLVSEEPPLEPPFEGDVEDPADGARDEAFHGACDADLDPLPNGRSHASLALAPMEESASVDEWTAGPQPRDRCEEKRRTFCEQLLEEWPSFSNGETLWIAECIVEVDEDPDGWHERASREATEVDDDGR